MVTSGADVASVGRYMGAYTVAFSLALVIAPVTGTAVYEHLGPSALWFGIGGIGLVLGAGFAALGPHFRAPHAGGETP